MHKFRARLASAFFTGLAMLLPIVIVAIVFRWLFRFVTDLIEPASNLLVQEAGFPALFSDLLVIAVIAIFLLILGFVISTTLGNYLQNHFHHTLQRVAPGYQMVREIVQQVFGDRKNSPFANGSVALVQLHGELSPVRSTAIVTSRHADGSYTVFIPTGPNPTTGFVYHVPENLVELRPEVKVEAALRTVIACGAGTAALFSGDQSGRKPIESLAVKEHGL